MATGTRVRHRIVLQLVNGNVFRSDDFMVSPEEANEMVNKDLTEFLFNGEPQVFYANGRAVAVNPHGVAMAMVEMHVAE